MENGIYYNVSDTEYFAIPRPSFSQIKHLLDNNIDLIDKKEDTEAMQFGRLLHKKFLQPELYTDTVAQIPSLLSDFKKELNELGFDTKGINSWEKAKELFNSACKKDIEYVKESDHNKIQELYNRFELQGLDKEFSNGNSEVVVLWTDMSTGLDMKAKIDYVSNDCIIDLKTIQHKAVRSLKKSLQYSVIDMHYHTQLAFYQIALMSNDVYIDKTKLIFVDKGTGQGYTINIPDEIIQLAVKNYCYVLRKYKELKGGKNKLQPIDIELCYTLDFQNQTDDLL